MSQFFGEQCRERGLIHSVRDTFYEAFDRFQVDNDVSENDEEIFYGNVFHEFNEQWQGKSKAASSLLDTPHNTERAHKFYEKAGFREVKEDDLPIKFSHPYKEREFQVLCKLKI